MATPIATPDTTLDLFDPRAPLPFTPPVVPVVPAQRDQADARAVADGEAELAEDEPYVRAGEEHWLLAHCLRCRTSFSVLVETVEELKEEAAQQLFHQHRPSGARCGRSHRDVNLYRRHLVVHDPKVRVVADDQPGRRAAARLVHVPCGVVLALYG